MSQDGSHEQNVRKLGQLLGGRVPCNQRAALHDERVLENKAADLYHLVQTDSQVMRLLVLFGNGQMSQMSIIREVLRAMRPAQTNSHAMVA